MKYAGMATTMQGLVKYHGMKDWKLRIPYHDSISVNTTAFATEATISDSIGDGRVYIRGRPSESATSRLTAMLNRLGIDRNKVGRFRVDSKNLPGIDGKGLGYSSSAGAVLALLSHRMFIGGEPEMKELSRVARLFAASASRSLVGGFARLYAGDDDESTYAAKFGDAKTMDLRMIIVPLASRVKTEDAHREVEGSPFFTARKQSAQKRCDEMEKAILQNDIRKLGELAEIDTLELHSITMTGANRMIIMTEDSIRIITKVRELRSEGIDAYFSMQTGPTVYINTTEKAKQKVDSSIRRLGYNTYESSVGGPAKLVT